ncbi:MAG: hypothetical protein LJE91_03615 [Gammaproteobacteria bacterium]|jgi:hypothetical protein|nr:hypothetical protein [Gammaproteobacteria bacterium]
MSENSDRNSESYALSDRNWNLLLDHYFHHCPAGSRPRPSKRHLGRTRKELTIEQVSGAMELWRAWHDLANRRDEG